ncbi:unnamed protein product [Lymnaea stagnalis]|uniref:Protein GAMETE EXPRESSED 1 n=1 Tax=Lymnaea stagnalis TaxID=6523 RepID=A0AAV2I064_LYMST
MATNVLRSILVFSVYMVCYTSTHRTEIDSSRFEEGKKQLELIQRKSEMPKYGLCWLNAMTLIKTECKRLSDVTQTRLALAYLNCFLQIQGRTSYECDDVTEITACVQHMNEADRSSFTTFFTHTQNICYFLQAQVWQEETEMTINRLTVTSTQVTEQLEMSQQLQKDMLSSQNQSIKNQETLIVQAYSLKQREIIGDLFNQLAKLQTTILGEVSGFYSLFFYLMSVLVCYLLTSTARTSGARIWLFLIMTVNVILEQTLIKWIAGFYSSGDVNSEQLYWLQKMIRRAAMLLALLTLTACTYLYKDINALNNQLLVEIRKQNSELKRFITDHSGSVLSIKKEAATRQADHKEDSIDSDYTSDNNDDDDDGDTDSDKTYILPENAETESFVTLSNTESNKPDISLLCELYELRKAIPMTDRCTSVQSWLETSFHAKGNNDIKTASPRPQSPFGSNPSSPYNLRPRKANASPSSSCAVKDESPRSFSKTVHQMQQIAEQNSRLIGAYKQSQPLSPQSFSWSQPIVSSSVSGRSSRSGSVTSLKGRGSATKIEERSNIVTRGNHNRK